MSGMWKRGHGLASGAPAHERAGNGEANRLHLPRHISTLRAAKLAAILAGESPARGTYPVATVVISGDGAGDQSVESPEVKVPVGLSQRRVPTRERKGHWVIRLREGFGQLRQGGEQVGRL
jgi:hypothetical protein